VRKKLNKESIRKNAADQNPIFLKRVLFERKKRSKKILKIENKTIPIDAQVSIGK
jgi:hypothetical protein